MKKYPLSISDILKRYKLPVGFLVIVAIASNLLNLVFPKLIASAVDAYVAHTFNLASVSWQFLGLAVIILILSFINDVMQVYVSERSAKDLRNDIIHKISEQSYMYTQEKTPAFLLTNLTSDVDAIKSLLSVAVPSLVASFLTLIAATVLILTTDWKLGLGVLTIIPLIGVTFFIAFSKMGKLFKKTQEIVDRLNTVINTTIVGAALVRILNSGKTEASKFTTVNATARDNGMRIVNLFAALVPIIMFSSNLASVIILYIGGNFVINNSMSIGQFAAFNSYISILIFPIAIIGFTSNMIGRAQASMSRIKGVFEAPAPKIEANLIDRKIHGDISVKDVSLTIGNKHILSSISFDIQRGSRTAIVGPTAAGKTQLLAILTGLIKPSSGSVLYDGNAIGEYNPNAFYANVGLVFQDSVLFNLSLKENIAFGESAEQAIEKTVGKEGEKDSVAMGGKNTIEENLQKAIRVAELDDFIHSLPNGLETSVSERGLSLSGGQKQRIMLARALSLNPSVLFLDDFTARVDAVTEKNILNNIAKEFPNLTLISVTQKIAPIEHYDKVVLLVEGELIKEGTHNELMHTTPEYVQIYESQKSTTHYEI